MEVHNSDCEVSSFKGWPQLFFFSMKSHLQKLVDKIVIQRQVLKGIILGSGVNWQQDNTLREQVIGLGEPLDI